MPIPFSFRWKLLLLFIAELVLATAWELRDISFCRIKYVPVLSFVELLYTKCTSSEYTDSSGSNFTPDCVLSSLAQGVTMYSSCRGDSGSVNVNQRSGRSSKRVVI
ncbi:hypothetical protein GQ600_13756 [Phytophthora cactorum]|nr:hypothetical protein GQ600_13756 [Phytophthora cactorum]